MPPGVLAPGADEHVVQAVAIHIPSAGDGRAGEVAASHADQPAVGHGEIDGAPQGAIPRPAVAVVVHPVVADLLGTWAHVPVGVVAVPLAFGVAVAVIVHVQRVHVGVGVAVRVRVPV
ncbi:MAG: hypothetical protein ABIO70_33125 [Pseudomonadota bacterium]